MNRLGVVYLVGAGPGDPGLITVRGAQLLRRADVIVYDRLIGKELLLDIMPGVELIDVGKKPKTPGVSQNGINKILIDLARRGKSVVRLKGGDPYVFGRGFEEFSACRDAGVPCVVIPGVSSAIAAPSAAGIPVTSRGLVRSVAIITGHTTKDEPVPDFDYAALATMDTIVILMGRARLNVIAQSLMKAGKNSATPAACIEQATTVNQRVVVATLANIADEADRKEMQAPMVTVIGEVAAEASSDESVFQSFGIDFSNELHAEKLEMSRPLTGKRIVITRPGSSGDDLQDRLTAEGATVIPCPFIAIEYPDDPEHSEEIWSQLDKYDWIVFTSQHGVIGFWKKLKANGLDARALATCKVAVVGPRSAHALTDYGIQADLMPDQHDAESLADALIRQTDTPLGRVLFAKGNLARETLPKALRKANAIVDEMVVYRTVDASPSEITRQTLEAGVDAVLFFSPSAIQRFVSLGFTAGDAVIGCIGPTTAAAAQEGKLPVHFISEDHSSDGLLAALTNHFAKPGVQI